MMNLHIGYIWLGLGLIFLIAELGTPGGFVLACFGISCFVTAFFSFVGFSFSIQVLIFSISSLALFFSIRRLFPKLFSQSANRIKTNVDALIGKTGVVSEMIDPSTGKGRVVVGGEDWKGVSVSDTVIEIENKVRIIKVDGTKLIVDEIKLHKGEV
jgi:membrane protein implicated in regulation of membrane protease activity